MADSENILPQIQNRVVLQAQLALGPCTSRSIERREVVLNVRAFGVVRLTFSRRYDLPLNHYFWGCDRAERVSP